MLESLLIGNNAPSRGRGWALVYLPHWDKRISCLTEWASFGCSTTKDLWTKVFFKVPSVWGRFLCYTSPAPQLVFHFDVAICAGHLNLSACVLTGTPEDINWRSFYELGIRSVGMMHSPLSKGNRNLPCWKLYWGHVCISDWELSQTDTTESYQDICNFCTKGKAVK